MKKVFVFFLINCFLVTCVLFAAGQRDAAVTRAGTSPAGRISYPINTDVTITYWASLGSTLGQRFTNFSETPFGPYIEQRTGINVEWIHPPSGMENETFNIMVASGDLPDIIERGFGNFPGGPERAIEEGVIFRLNDIIANWAPNLADRLRDNPDFDRMVRTDEGSYYVFPFIQLSAMSRITDGPIIRRDWLDELGLAMPETIDDWENVLIAFRDRKGALAPFTFEYTNNSYFERHAFSLAWMSPGRFFVGDDGRMQYGPILDGRREYLRVFARWYREGLIDSDLITMRQANVTQRILTDASGAAHGAIGSRMGAWIDAAASAGNPIDLAGAPWPVLRRGDRPRLTPIVYPFNPGTGGNTGISGKASRPDIAARLLDWGYSDEGHNLFNFGIEGESYTWVNNYPQYTDYVLRSPLGLNAALSEFVRATGSGPFFQDERYQIQFYASDIQKETSQLWAIPESIAYALPPISPTVEESRELAQIMNAVITQRNEMEARFIMGLEPLTDANWNAYMDRMRQLGIDRAIEIQNAALERFNRR